MSTMDTRRRDMDTAWTGWIGFAAIMLALIGSITFFEGLVAIFRDEYYVLTEGGALVFDLTTWGWIMLFWGIILFIAGLGLAAKSGWARWFTIIVVSLNLIAQLGFLGNTAYPLWTLVIVGLEIVVLYALTARWGEVHTFE
ncbi:MAG TPA: hypothetical protein VFT86_07320 [Gaiellaceae bacterium]|nr:hypothetical protein [Gaiellaceae bacterium]